MSPGIPLALISSSNFLFRLFSPKIFKINEQFFIEILKNYYSFELFEIFDRDRNIRNIVIPEVEDL